MPILDRLKHGVDVTKFKADQLLRINRIQNEIGDLRYEIQVVRDKIANAVIDLHKQSALSQLELEKPCLAIDQIEAQIAEKESQIASVRAELPPQVPSPAPQYVAYPPTPVPAVSSNPVNPCSNCRFDVPVGAAFCPNCGKPMPPRVVATSTGPASNSSKCANCGFDIPAEAAFCPNCGTAVVSVNETQA